MPRYELSGWAEKDIKEIFKFSYVHFGPDQADRYIDALFEKFGLLAENPELGRNASHIRNGYFRYEYESHSIFYKKTGTGILVVRILHGRMDPERHS